MYKEELEELRMTPEMWSDLDRELDETEYRRMVIDYQRREYERLPYCSSLFGVCRNFDGGHCTSGACCKHKNLNMRSPRLV